MINESSQPRSLINELPSDILCEIFSRCIDGSSEHIPMQPNTKIAPMLLCQVCATWRAVVLSISLFWSHLRLELPLNWHLNGRPFTWDPEGFSRRLEWLKWWRRNLALMAPYLQVELRRGDSLSSSYRKGRLSNPAAEFLLELMTSAQYISVGRLYRYLVQQRREAGYVVRVHPSAHTVVSACTPGSPHEYFDTSDQYFASVLTQTRSTLQHLVIEDARLRPQEFANPLNNWSTLTHLSMGPLFMHLEAWFSFIRSLSALQSGSFCLRLLEDDFTVYVRPPVGILPCLSVFHMSAAPNMMYPGQYPGQYPLKAVFDNLRLPALRTLSLDSRGLTWCDASAITDVHAALLSAPALTKLSFGTSFLGGQAYKNPAQYLGVTAIKGDVEPFATYAPRLEHISFMLRSPLRQCCAFDFVPRVFASSRWLDMKDPASTIQKITFVSSGTLGPDDLAAELVDRSLFISEVRRFVKDEVTVEFEDEEPVEVRRARWGW